MTPITGLDTAEGREAERRYRAGRNTVCCMSCDRVGREQTFCQCGQLLLSWSAQEKILRMLQASRPEPEPVEVSAMQRLLSSRVMTV